jgi:hypothetical protein
MTSEPVKQLALGLVGCQVADQRAFGRVFSEFFDLRQIVLHRSRGPAFFCGASPREQAGVNATIVQPPPGTGRERIRLVSA